VVMGKAHRWVGYLSSFASASLFYIVSFTVRQELDGPRSIHSSLADLGFAVFLWLFDGIAVALVLMALPWYGVVQLAARRHGSNLLYFALCGAAITLVLSCATSSLAPKPIFVEDQSFIEGFVITAQRQGIDLLLTGFVFGITFWLVSERLRRARSIGVP